MSFSRIKGQELPIRIIKNSLKKERLGDAYLFYGPGGVGKKLTALNLAKLVNCSSGSDEPCDECPSCRRIDEDNHPDIHIVVKDEDARDLKIDQIRQLEDNIYLKPFEGKKKVFIIDGADDMNEQAQNALLKTLEEPPANSILILLSENIQTLLETIHSRCSRLRFNRLSVEHITGILIEQYGLDQEEALVLARVSEGSLEKAAELKEYFQNRRELITKISKGLANLADDDQWVGLDREEAIDLLKFVSNWCRDVLLVQSGVDQQSMLINPDYGQELADFSNFYDTDRLLDIMGQIHKTMGLIKGNVNTKLALEVLWNNV
ncbi:MAG: DNA polymerase III subunit delta' [Candidatus Omnitrophica bacterium]|nr:DNA polymerase III subunit delta' [Candidatus Omnitrophota bacterium]